MLSIGKVTAGQHSYYEKQVAQGRDDYYSGKGEAPGMWIGAVAAELGLDGKQVKADAFNAMIVGRDPSDPALDPKDRDTEPCAPEDARWLRADKKAPELAAYDLTFSAPKSLSVLYAVADEATSRELASCHDAAVHAALGYLENEAVKVRRGKGSKIVKEGNGILAAAYRHRMSRALDPQLHTHVVAANVTRGPEGRWSGLWGTPLYKHAKAAGTLYQAHLRAEVRERLGLEWGDVTKGSADLSAVAPEVLSEFSKRRHEMERAAAASGIALGTKDQGSAVAVGTRSRKQYEVDTGSWREEVRARAAEHGLTKRAIARVFRAGEIRRGTDELGRTTSTPTRSKDVDERLSTAGGLSEMANGFTGRDAIIEIASAYRQGIRVPGARKHTAAFLKLGDIPQITPDDAPGLQVPEARYTTAALVTVETKLVTAALERTDTRTAVVSQKRLERALRSTDRPLNAQQDAAVRAVATSGNGVDVIEALAGTGKTYTAGVIRRVYEEAGTRILGVAPTGRAVRELRDEAGLKAQTIDSVLHALEVYDDHLPNGGVVLLDEAGMASTLRTEQLLRAAAAANCKVIAIGDSGQLPSVQAGGWLKAIGDRQGRNTLDEVMRQRDPLERRMLGLLHDGAPKPYVQWLDTAGRLTPHPEPAEALSAAIDDWVTATGEHGHKDAVLIARNNATRQALNGAARSWRLQHDELDAGDERSYGGISLAPGDRVICRRNSYDHDVDNGSRGTITAVRRKEAVLRTDSGDTRTLPADYIKDHVEHAYALTGHGMQGGTVEWAGVVATPQELTRGWSYTALSRARGATVLHMQGDSLERLADRADIAPHDAPEDTGAAGAPLVDRVAARMIVRDDEDLAVDQLLVPREAPDPAEVGVAAPERDVASADLVDLRLELADRERELRALPTDLIERLGRLQAEHERTIANRAEFEDRLGALPDAPERRGLRTPVDEHAGERSRLRSAIVATDTHLQTMFDQYDQLSAKLGVDADVVLERAAELLAEQQVLGDGIATATDRLAEIHLAERPAWATDRLGERPSGAQAGATWDATVRAVARYRLDQDPAADLSTGIGEPPTSRAGRERYDVVAAEAAAVRDELHPELAADDRDDRQPDLYRDAQQR